MVAKQDKYTKSARGQECQVRVPGVCNYDSSTTVLAHLNGAGVGRKKVNIHGAYSCFDCHAWLDGGYVQTGHLRSTRDLYHLEGVIRTQELMIEMGILKL